MKNIHLIPATESRLYYTISMSGYNLKLSAIPIHRSSEVRPQHIYITNDEEIKEGDKILSPTNEIQTCISLEKGIGTDNICWIRVKETTTLQQILNSDKIILTTDQDLIKDGVQAIDDYFLEWFVKNPNCEEVEVQCRYNFYVGQDLTHYKIIIPKEEHPKQETLEEEKLIHSLFVSETEEELLREFEGESDEEPKQETLEEAAEKYYKKLYEGEPLTQDVPIDAFKQGAKWQMERMYSEEEVLKLLIYCKNKFGGSGLEDYVYDSQVKNWFENFKKK